MQTRNRGIFVLLFQGVTPDGGHHAPGRSGLETASAGQHRRPGYRGFFSIVSARCLPFIDRGRGDVL